MKHVFPSARTRTGRTLLGILCSLGISWIARTARGTEADFHVDASRDNLTLNYARGELSLKALDTRAGSGLLRTHAVYASAHEVSGIPGGFRYFGGASVGWSIASEHVLAEALAGLWDYRKLDSASAEGKLTYRFDKPSGLSLTARASSTWLDNWLAYSVRHTSAAISADLASDNDYAALGAEIARRTGGLTRRSELPLSLPDNRLLVAYGWWAHAFFPWFLAGGAATFNDSQRDLHQASSVVDGRLRYVDYPYPTPHSEVAFGALVEVHIGPAKLKTNFPVFSDGGYRVEDPFQANAIYYYRAHGMSVATFEGSLDIPLGKPWTLLAGAHAQSRPYRPYAWFSADAWNEYGLTLGVRYRSIGDDKAPETQSEEGS